MSGTREFWSISVSRLLTCDASQGSALVALFFTIFINDTDSGIKCTFRKFADDTRNGCYCCHNRWWMLSKGTWTNLSSIARKNSWSSTSTNAWIFIRVKEVSDMGKPGWRTRWGHPYEEEFLWMEAGHQPVEYAYSSESQEHPGLHQNKNGQQAKGRFSFYSPLLRWWWFRTETPTQGRCGPIRETRATKMVLEDQGAGTPLLWRQTERHGGFQPGVERLWGHLISAFRYLKRAFKRDGEWLYTCTDSDTTSGSNFKQTEGIFILDL